MKDFQNKQIYCQTGKACYTEREAGIVINSARRRRYSDKSRWRKDIPRRKYYCTECGFYHVTHHAFYQPKKQGRVSKLVARK